MVWAILATLFEVAGIVSAVHAVMRTRTSQGAIAWTLALVLLPIVAVPLYWVFGRRKFAGYNERWRARRADIDPLAQRAGDNLEPHLVRSSTRIPAYQGLQALTRWPLARGNELTLLVDGEATFASILEGIEAATSYVLVEFYIVRDDGIGRRLKDKLIQKAREGVRVYFVYDGLGSKGLPAQYVNELRAAGAEMTAFRTTQGRGNLFQLNFRNHRKIVIVDGRVAGVGGLNVGDEYLGLDPRMTPWRDTHMRLAGPAVLGAQVAFLLDWCWATKELLDLSWGPRSVRYRGQSGPALLHGSIRGARDGEADLHPPHQRGLRAYLDRHAVLRPGGWRPRRRCVWPRYAEWTSAYSYPKHNDNRFVQFASYYYMQDLSDLPIRFLQLPEGFMHQKVMLVDEEPRRDRDAHFRQPVLPAELRDQRLDARRGLRRQGGSHADCRHGSRRCDGPGCVRRPFLLVPLRDARGSTYRTDSVVIQDRRPAETLACHA